MYNYIDQSLLYTKNIDLPRRVRYPIKRKNKRTSPKDNTIRKGRTYEDFQNYLQDNPNIQVVEMDTVDCTTLIKAFSFLLYLSINSLYKLPL